MASVHVYVRVQASGSNAQTDAIANAVQTLRTAVEAAGGEWFGRGDVQVERDAVVIAAKHIRKRAATPVAKAVKARKRR